MNISTLLGIVSGLTVLSLSFWLTVDTAAVFVNLPGLLLVVGGTFAATLISYPLREILRIFHVIVTVFRTEQRYGREDIDEIVEVARLWFKGEIRPVEEELDRVRSPFLRTGIQLVIDGTPIDDILDLMRWRIARLKARERNEAQLFRTMAMFAPAFGMTGTLLGLVNMLSEMGSGSFDRIGLNMAVALITTFYGVLLANLLCKPVAIKLERRTDRRVAILTMVMEGITLISERRSPTFIRETLLSFAAEHEDELGTVAPPAAATPSRDTAQSDTADERGT